MAKIIWNRKSYFKYLFFIISGLFFTSVFISVSAADLTVTGTTTLNAGSYNYDTVHVTSTGTLILKGNPSLSGFKGVEITATTFTIDSGGKVSADGLGNVGGSTCGNAGAGTGHGYGSNCYNYRGGGGASYGGTGGDGYNIYGQLGSYGSLSEPTDLGSGGGASANGKGGNGGGAIKLNIAGTLSVNGIITCNGNDGVYNSYGQGGGGSGGSIYIITNVIAGSGTVRANGGSGLGSSSYDGGGGAGGRISVKYNSKTFSGTVTAYGGTGYKIGGAGTVYWYDRDLNGEQKLIIDRLLDEGKEVIAWDPLALENFKKDLKLYRLIKNHERRWFWITRGYEGDVLTFSDFVKRIQKYVKLNPHLNIP